MTGVGVVGLSGLLAERRMKEDSLLAHAVAFLTDPDAGPDATQQATKVLAGEIFLPFYLRRGAYISSDICFSTRRIFHFVCSDLVSIRQTVHSSTHPIAL